MERISHYKIVRKIGAGGMGEVWRAVDERLGRDVAIKVLGRRATAERAQRMMREAKAASALNHPGIVTVHDVGDHDGHPYLVMELVEGMRFSELGRQPPIEALRLCALAADALGTAHERGILHRDIKSDNLMRLPDGRVKVLDFGLAKVGSDLMSSVEVQRAVPMVSATAATHDSSERTPIPPEGPAFAPTVDSSTRRLVVPAVGSAPSDLTRAGDIMGTPAYMSPEQARGEPADTRSEVFSLGVVLYELLVGRRPFVADDVEEMLELVRRTRVEPPSQVAGDPALARYDELVALCLAADPHARPRDMRELARLLRAAAQPARRRSRKRLIAAGVVITAAAGIAGAIVALRPEPASAPPAAPTSGPVIGNISRLTLESGCDEFPSVSPDGRRVIYDAARGSSYVLEEIADGKRRELTTGGAWDIAPAISPDGKQLAFLRKMDGPYHAMVDDIDLLGPVRDLTIGAVRPRWSPDGKAVWAGEGRQLIRWSLATGKAERTLAAPSGLVALVSLELADGTVTALLFDPQSDGYPSGVVAWDPAGQMRWLYRGELDEVLWPSPDGHGVVVSRVVETHRELAIVPLAGGSPVPLHQPGVDARKGLTATPDWRYVAWSDCTQRIDIVIAHHVGNEVQLTPVASDTWADTEPVAVGATRQLVIVSDRSGDARPWLIDRDNQMPARMVTDAEVTRLDVTVDGKMLVYNNDAGEIWKVALDGASPPVKLAAKPGLNGPAVAPDGTIYVPGDDGQIYKVPLAGGRLERWLAGGAPAASPRGKLVIYARGNVPVDRTLVVRDLATGTEHPLSSTLPVGEWSRTRFSADGSRIAVMRGESEILVIEVATGKVLDRVAGTSRTFMGAVPAGPTGEDLIVGENWWRGNISAARR